MWDEIAMCHRYCTEALDRSLHNFTIRNASSGGKCVLFYSDFRQILPAIHVDREIKSCTDASRLQPSRPDSECCVKQRTYVSHLYRTIRMPHRQYCGFRFVSFFLGKGEQRVGKRQYGASWIGAERFGRRCSMHFCFLRTRIKSHWCNISHFKNYSVYGKLQLIEINANVGSRFSGSYKTFSVPTLQMKRIRTVFDIP